MAQSKIPDALREEVVQRARSRCEYCLAPQSHSVSMFEVDHISPRVRGGSDDLDNLALACRHCNGAKHARIQAVDPITGDTYPLYNPRLDQWSEHFQWSEDFTEIVGISAVGRATVALLEMNRPGVVNLRRVLQSAGLHPPQRTGLC